MYIADKARDQFERIETLKQANETEEIAINHQNKKFMDQVRSFEDQLIQDKLAKDAINLASAPVLPIEIKPAKDPKQFQPLKTKTYTFLNRNRDSQLRQFSAQDTYSHLTLDESTKRQAHGFAEFYNHNRIDSQFGKRPS